MKQLYLLLRIENGIATYSSPNPQIRPPIDRTRTAYMSGVLVPVSMSPGSISSRR
jgi:hypothetical protein